jgi:hypothetical protein
MRSWLMKKMSRARAVRDAGELAQGLAHEARLQAHVLIAHLALDLGARHERRDRVDDDEIHRAAAHERLDDLERLLARVRLAHEQRLRLDPEARCVAEVERVLGVDEGRDAALPLALGDQRAA